MTPGSIAPERVPIGSPSSAVKPIVVATLFPSRIAHMLQPFPRCAATTRPARTVTDDARQDACDVLVREAVEPVPLDALADSSRGRA